MLKKHFTAAGFVLLLLAFMKSYGQNEPLANQIKSSVQHEAITVNALIQTGFRYSLNDDNFQGGRTFEAYNARLSFRGIIDKKFIYRLFFNLASEPNILDAYAGYRYSDAFQLMAGMMKPRQTMDYIPNPGATDFIDRTIITGLLVQSREIGVALEGKIGGLYYYGGIFNGTEKRVNNNNKFYSIGRIQYTFENLLPGTFQLGIHGSAGDSPGVRSGSKGPVLRGKRAIYGGDFRLESNSLLLAGEYLTGELETESLPNEKELISGYYFTGGFRFLEQTMALARWQTWGQKINKFRDNKLTLGVNHNFTSLTSFQFNFDTYYPENGDIKTGLSCLLQIQF